MAERTTFGQWSFNGGELSQRMQGRSDQAVYQIALAEMLGFIPLLQGPAVAAPGTHYVETAAGACRLIPFEYNPTQGYVVETSALKFRFYTNDARIDTSPGTAYEVAHGYSYAEVLALDFQQSADVLYLAGASKKPKKLSRVGSVNFTFSDLVLRNGPIDIGNNDEAVTVQVSSGAATVEVGATCTVTASSAIFSDGDVDGLFEIEAKDFSDIHAWEPGAKMTVGQKRTWAGKVYECTSLPPAGTRTGGVPPEHESGEEWDGSAYQEDLNGQGPFGCKWLYLHNRYGLVRITAFTSATEVSALVLKRLADSVRTAPTWKWAFGAFSDTRGWPETVRLWNDCLVLTKANKGYTSVIGDFDNFERRDSSGDFQRDLAGQFTLPTSSRIQWTAADRMLLIGSEDAEYTIERVQVQTGTPGPPVFEIRLQSSNGSAKTKPIQADGRMLMVQRAGRKLRELGYAIAADRYQAPDMTRLADHIGTPGFLELAWQAEPERLAWAALQDGTMAGMTYDPQQEVMGWFRRELGGALAAKSLCRITDPSGDRDQLWIAAETEAGAFWVLRMAKIWEFGDDQADAFLVDAGLTYSGSAADEISGLDHLNGLTVDILADGKVHPSQLVAGGAVTLEYEASTVQVGLPFTARIKTLPPEHGQQEGVAQMKLQRLMGVSMRVVEMQGLRVRAQDGDWQQIETRTADDPMDEAVPLYTGDKRIPTIGRYDRRGQIEIERYQPTPATIVAIVPAHEVGEQ